MVAICDTIGFFHFPEVDHLDIFGLGDAKDRWLLGIALVISLYGFVVLWGTGEGSDGGDCPLALAFTDKWFEIFEFWHRI